MGAFKYLGERAGNTSVTGSRVTAALKFLNYNANTNSIKCILFRLIMILFYGHPVFSFDNYRFIPRRAGTVHCWPDLVSRIRFSQWPPIQTDSVRLCLVLCIYHLTIRFPPGGRTRLLLARSVFTCYCSEQRRVSGRHNQTKLGNVPDVTTGPAPWPPWSAASQCDQQLMELLWHNLWHSHDVTEMWSGRVRYLSYNRYLPARLKFKF